MFQRVLYEHWQTIFPLIGFILFGSLFIFLVIRAVRMKKSRRDHLKNLPLENDEKPRPTDDDRSAK
ncbi:MAG: cbb3-type cytochrome c oxidase subunit 3 [Puniceicoccaceae bacterium]|nr:MAG: cbb3-type cytochrome c oxidase subunit 3 [Puniceicoccaceae bacterium]